MTDGKKITPFERRLRDAAADILEAEADNPEFLHSVLCQVGLPRRATTERSFTRTSGSSSISIEAGKWWDGKRWVESPLPYGAKPRLVLIHVCAEAVRTKSPEIDIGHSMRDFLGKLGLDTSGHEYPRFKSQMHALSTCSMQIGLASGEKVVNISTRPVRRFDAWLQQDGLSLGLWPGYLELSLDFMETLLAHAVPLDPRAIGALQGSALSLDIYAWLAHRLCRIRKDAGLPIYWKNLRDQFGQEYKDPKDFKKQFLVSLKQALAVYPDARVEQVTGGLRLFPSAPPIRKASIVVPELPKPTPTASLNVSPEALDRVRLVAPGWDKYHLESTWREWHVAKGLAAPDDPNKAFVAWAKKYTKGKPPR